MNNRIEEMISAYVEEKDFYGETTEEQIVKTEGFLGFKFPKEYREFVKMYGSGGICGVQIAGIEGDLGASVIKATERWRRLGLDKSIVVIEDVGEFIMCMNTSNNDSKVYVWYRIYPKLVERYESFTSFLIDNFQEGIDNY